MTKEYNSAWTSWQEKPNHNGKTDTKKQQTNAWVKSSKRSTMTSMNNLVTTLETLNWLKTDTTGRHFMVMRYKNGNISINSHKIYKDWQHRQ